MRLYPPPRVYTPEDLQHSFEVEPLFDEFVVGAGGELVRDILPPSPAFPNADYLFLLDNVVVELKSIQTDYTGYGRWQKKLDGLFGKWIAEGSVTEEMRARPEMLPLSKRRKIRDLYESPFRGLIQKANKQLRDTAQNFKLDGAAKLLVLVNDGLYSTDFGFTVAVVSRLLGRGTYSNIHGFVYLTVNRYVELAGDPYARQLWAPAYDDRAPTHLHPFVNRLGSAWFDFLGGKIGGWDHSIKTNDATVISDTRYILGNGPAPEPSLIINPFQPRPIIQDPYE